MSNHVKSDYITAKEARNNYIQTNYRLVMDELNDKITKWSGTSTCAIILKDDNKDFWFRFEETLYEVIDKLVNLGYSVSVDLFGAEDLEDNEESSGTNDPEEIEAFIKKMNGKSGFMRLLIEW